MMLNYHEMTMGQPANDPAKKQQFVVITTVMISVLCYSLMTSGALLPIDPVSGIFPGGNFVYKLENRDYAASMGMGRVITKELLQTEGKEWHRDGNDETKEVESKLYHLYLDDPMQMGGRRQRWATGILVSDEEKGRVDALMETNAKRTTTPVSQDVKNDISAREYFERLPYQFIDLPSVDALVLQFPNTHGFVSALTLSYRVIPALRKIAKSKGVADPVVFMLCSKAQEMCTHYVPLAETQVFHLGLPTTDEHNAALGPEYFLDWKGFKEGGRKVLPFATKFIDMLP